MAFFRRLRARLHRILKPTDTQKALDLVKHGHGHNIPLKTKHSQLSDGSPPPSTPFAATGSGELLGLPPEVLEMILLNLQPLDVFSMEQTCRFIRSTVASSSILLKHLMLRPDDCAPRFHTDTSHGTKHIHIRALPKGEQYRGMLSADPDFQVRELWNFFVGICFDPEPKLKLGSRVRSMLVCQPPIYRMDVNIQCCDPADGNSGIPPDRYPQPLHSNTGITIGQLYDATRQLVEEHRLCSFARLRHHDGNGFVDVRPMFLGTVALRMSDPLVQLELESRVGILKAWFMTWSGKWTARKVLKEYRYAKRDAWEARCPIPTLQEFCESRIADAEVALPLMEDLSKAETDST